jgi:oxalate decarboxylase/phosphoglucose isomerase-like protein (cupin superfamily)
MRGSGDIVEVGRHDGEGYVPVIDSDGEWIVALMNWCPSVTMGQLGKIEKHVSTDEVFVLTAGRGALIVGPRGEEPRNLRVIDMEPNVVYNVKREVWHALILSADGRTVIVERRGPETIARKPTPALLAQMEADIERLFGKGQRLPFPPVGRLVAVGRHDQPGYKAVVDSDTDWIAAVINGGAPAVSHTPQKTMAYHPDTDEVFVLTKGVNALLVAPPGETIGDIRVIEMDHHVAYNVKAGTWHASCMSEEATMIVAEGRDPASVSKAMTAEQLAEVEDEVRRALGT